MRSEGRCEERQGVSKWWWPNPEVDSGRGVSPQLEFTSKSLPCTVNGFGQRHIARRVCCNCHESGTITASKPPGLQNQLKTRRLMAPRASLDPEGRAFPPHQMLPHEQILDVWYALVIISFDKLCFVSRLSSTSSGCNTTVQVTKRTQLLRSAGYHI